MRKTTQSTIAAGLLAGSVLASAALWADDDAASGNSMMDKEFGMMSGHSMMGEDSGNMMGMMQQMNRMMDNCNKMMESHGKMEGTTDPAKEETTG
jgi:hypothetical protein